MRVADFVRTTVSSWRARRSLRRCDLVGEGTRIIGRPYIDNLGKIEIGADLKMSALPVRSHLVAGKNGIIRIGDHVRIAHGVAICAHTAITIGDGTTLGPFALVLDADVHDVSGGIAPAASRPIHIGRNVLIGAGAVILRGAVIGDDVEIAPNSVVSRRLPAGVRAAGVPARPVSEATRLG